MCVEELSISVYTIDLVCIPGVLRGKRGMLWSEKQEMGIIVLVQIFESLLCSCNIRDDYEMNERSASVVICSAPSAMGMSPSPRDLLHC